MENSENLERRRFKRVESTVPIQYKDLRKIDGFSKDSLTKNISEGGLSFQSREFISLACRLVVEINLPNQDKPVKAISKVAWIRKIPASDDYELGNQFLNISKEDRAQIIDFMNKLLHTSI